MATGSDVLSDPLSLTGTWQLSRVIDDRLSGQESRIDGVLTLTAVSPDRVRWVERGHWHQPGGDVEVHRHLWVVRDDESASWWVRFDDEREFHPWAPGEQVIHPCGADTYRGVVAGTPEQWTVAWDVTGPAKDYLMRTTLRPSGLSPS